MFFQTVEIPKSSSVLPRKVPALPPLPTDFKNYESDLYEVSRRIYSLTFVCSKLSKVLLFVVVKLLVVFFLHCSMAIILLISCRFLNRKSELCEVLGDEGVLNGHFYHGLIIKPLHVYFHWFQSLKSL